MIKSIWLRLWVGVSGAFFAGACVGFTQALMLLSTLGATEYSALFWGVMAYGAFATLIGAPIGLLFWTLKPLESPPRLWAAHFIVVFCAGQLFCGLGLTWVLLLFFPLLWALLVLLTRTPVKIIVTPKGSAAFSTLAGVLLAVFSLNPDSPKPVHNNVVSNAPGNRLNVLIILAEGLRSDHLRMGISPALDQIVSNGVVFDNALSNSPNVTTALAGILHGERGFVGRSPVGLAERLRTENYHSFAVVNSPEIGRFDRYSRGFVNYEYLQSVAPIPLREGPRQLPLMKWLLQHWQRQRSQPDSYYQPAETVLFKVHREIMLTQKPWFGLAQLSELEVPLFIPTSNGGVEAIFPHQATSQDTYRGYVEELRRLDNALSRFLTIMKNKGLLKNTVIVLTATHSTQLQPEPNRALSRKNSEHVKIPLVIMAPMLEHRRVEQMVQLSDLPTTLTGLLNVHRQAEWGGVNIVHQVPNNRAIISVSQSVRDHTPDWTLVQSGNWRLVQDAQAGEQLYDLSTDPFERRNLIRQEPGQRQELLRLLEGHRHHQPGNRAQLKPVFLQSETHPKGGPSGPN